MRNKLQFAVLLIVAIGLLSAIAPPVPARGQTAIEWIVLERLAYRDFQLQDRPGPRIVDSGYTIAHVDFRATGNGTFSSASFPEIDGTIQLQQVFGIAATGSDGNTPMSNPERLLRGRTAGRAILTFQDGQDIILRFRGYSTGTATLVEVTGSGDRTQRINLVVGATTNHGDKLSLELVGIMIERPGAGFTIQSLEGSGVLRFGSRDLSE